MSTMEDILSILGDVQHYEGIIIHVGDMMCALGDY